MGIISLELNRKGPAPESSPGPIELIEQLQTLIRGIALHSVESRPEDLAQFQHYLGEVADSLTNESSAADLMVAIGKTLRLTEDYNQHASVIFKSQVDELRGMVSKMSETMQFIVSSSELSVKQLAYMDLQLQRASGLDDLRQLKTYTSACLSLVRKESQRLQTETRERVEALKGDVERLSVRLKAASVHESQDLVTGLPGRAAAEQAIEEKISANKTFAAALFLMDRLSAINGRFGHAVGDEVVVSCAHLLAKKLPGATLYRWSGPGFLAIFDPSIRLAEAENRAKQAGAQQLEKTIEGEERELLIAVGFICHVLEISAGTPPDDLYRSLDGMMVAGNAG